MFHVIPSQLDNPPRPVQNVRKIGPHSIKGEQLPHKIGAGGTITTPDAVKIVSAFEFVKAAAERGYYRAETAAIMLMEKPRMDAKPAAEALREGEDPVEALQ